MNPYCITLSLYILGIFIQSLITIHFMRKRMGILVDEHDYTNKELNVLFVVSILLWPYSFYQGFLAYWESLRYTPKIEVEDE